MRRFVRWDSVRVRRGWVCLDLRLTFFCIFLFVVVFYWLKPHLVHVLFRGVASKVALGGVYRM